MARTPLTIQEAADFTVNADGYPLSARNWFLTDWRVSAGNGISEHLSAVFHMTAGNMVPYLDDQGSPVLNNGVPVSLFETTGVSKRIHIRNSPAEIVSGGANPDFDPGQPVSETNSPTLLASIPAKTPVNDLMALCNPLSGYYDALETAYDGGVAGGLTGSQMRGTFESIFSGVGIAAVYLGVYTWLLTNIDPRTGVPYFTGTIVA